MTDADRTVERAAEIRARLSKSTLRDSVPHAWIDYSTRASAIVRVSTDAETTEQAETDRALLRLAPTDLGFLLAERDAALARARELEDQLAKARAELAALGEGGEEWAVRVFTRADHKHWFHQHADAETFEEDLAMTLSVMANSIDLVTDAPPVNHGFAVVKRTVRSTEWETVKTVPATGKPTTALDVGRAEELIGPDTLCPCGKVNDGTGSGYCSAEHFEKYDGYADED